MNITQQLRDLFIKRTKFHLHLSPLTSEKLVLSTLEILNFFHADTTPSFRFSVFFMNPTLL